MGEVVEGVKFEQKHGKERVRVGRVWRNQNDGFHYFVEWSVGISLFSDCVAVYVRDDNSDLVASDTLKNTVYVKTKECTEQISAEEFAIKLANHFMNFYLQVSNLGLRKHITEVILKKSGALRITSGIEGLALLKTAKGLGSNLNSIDRNTRCSPESVHDYDQ